VHSSDSEEAEEDEEEEEEQSSIFAFVEVGGQRGPSPKCVLK
jgi:hypothetical protein